MENDLKPRSRNNSLQTLASGQIPSDLKVKMTADSPANILRPHFPNGTCALSSQN